MILDVIDHILALSVYFLARDGHLWSLPCPLPKQSSCHPQFEAVTKQHSLFSLLAVLPRSHSATATKLALREMLWITLDTASRLGDVWLLNHLFLRGTGCDSHAFTPRFRHAVDLAGEHGHAHVLKWLFSKRPNLLLSWTEAALDKASEHGHLAVLEWWLADSGIRAESLKFSSQAMDLASANGHLHVLTWWFTHFASRERLLYTDAAMALAAHNGHVHILEWWLQHAKHGLVLKHRHILDHAAEGGQLAVLDWCMTRLRPRAPGHPLSNTHNCGLVLNAITAGHIDVLSWWDDNAASFAQGSSNTTAKLAHAAASKGNLAALQWLVAKDWYVGHQSDVFSAAIASGDLATIQWIHAHPASPPPTPAKQGRGKRAPSVSPWTSSVTASNEPYYLATKRGHVHVLIWLAHHSNHRPHAKTNYKTIASAHGFLDALAWWWAYDTTSRRLEPMALIRATDAGHVHILRWWKTTGLLTPRVPLGAGLLDAACAAGHVGVIDWWMRESGVAIDYDKHAMDDASAHGHLGVLDWWAQSGLPLKYSHEAVDGACAAGHVHVLRWWIEFAGAGRAELLYTGRALMGLARARPDVAARVWQRYGLDTAGTVGVMDWGDLLFVDVWRQALRVRVDAHPMAMDWNSAEGDVAKLEHLARNHDGAALVFTQAAMGRATAAGHVHVLEWWWRLWKRGKVAKLHVPADVLALCKSPEVEQWWLDSGLL